MTTPGSVDYSPWPAWLYTEGWYARRLQAIMVVGETPKRYRVQSADGDVVRLSGRSATIRGTETALVPKYAVTKREAEA